MSLIIRPRADRDLDEQFDYIARDNSRSARRFYDAARATFEALTEFPGLGSLWESSTPTPAGLRVWPVRGFKNHLIFYRPIDEGIEILRVLYATRDLQGIFEAEGR